MEKAAIDALLKEMQAPTRGEPTPRVKAIVDRIVRDLFYVIDEYDVEPSEFWSAVNYLTQAGRNDEYGLIAAGLGFERFLDVRLDAAEEAAGLTGGTPRTIEGPLYVAGAPLCKGEARLDDGSEEGEILIMHGQVRDTDGRPVAGAHVEVWHANTRGNYSFFDKSQSPFNLRRTIETDADGRYRFRTTMPSGYAVPPEGSTDTLLKQLGRHGHRPAHIHFFVSAPGFRKLTTQINIDGDPYLHDDFAFATRDGLIPAVERNQDPDAIAEAGLNAPFARIAFDFELRSEALALPSAEVQRPRAEAA
ncbi:catechol 1,2-dioxygenase [Xanthobacter versatilis]|uniref:catechol 1,2-dioxygenase n=1 Tax=Xanthobacter autotrophicus (strain ATCC BAA-1158 / Py2) TaxID=78245 RepID=A7INI4_XANP2|nr:catechol 1,2-dioxygenase [Xanthobacter autotrophicus Py2]